jgi:hypothetical protein
MVAPDKKSSKAGSIHGLPDTLATHSQSQRMQLLMKTFVFWMYQGLFPPVNLGIFPIFLGCLHRWHPQITATA